MIAEMKKDKPMIHLILLSLLIKIICMGVFSSDYQNKMFMPFINDWIESCSYGFINPYEQYFEKNIHINFPYPSFMLATMTLGGLLSNLVSGISVIGGRILFKLPLLIFDYIGFIYLVKIFPQKIRSCCYIYLFSPIILYAIYMHGQLDIIPMNLLLVALYYLAEKDDKKSFIISAVMTGLALLSKLHILAIIPLLLIYIYRRYGLHKTGIYLMTVSGILVAGILPFYGQGFLEGVVFNSEQSTLFSLRIFYDELEVYVSLFAIVMIYLHIFTMHNINRELLFGFCGMLFGVFLSLCAPMPGWYVWMVPFLSIFILNVDLRNDSVLGSSALQISYLVYFVFLHNRPGVTDLYFLEMDCSFLKIDNIVIKNCGFTVLTATLLYMIYLMYKFGITKNKNYYFTDKSFVIGVCGDSASGKTTIQDSLSNLFKESVFLGLEGDGDHKWERGDKNWEFYTHMDPKANYLYRQAADIRKLKNGQATKRVVYDHETGKFTQSAIVYPKRFISISGLHTFYLPQMRDILDLKIFMEADEELRCKWKMERDMGKRGHSKEEILAQIQSRYEDVKKYIVPQKEYADIIISYFIEKFDEFKIGMKMHIDTQIDCENIVFMLQEQGVAVTYEFSEDFRYQVIEYHPADDKVNVSMDFEKILLEAIDYVYDITSEQFNITDICDGIQKLFLLKAISTKLRGG